MARVAHSNGKGDSVIVVTDGPAVHEPGLAGSKNVVDGLAAASAQPRPSEGGVAQSSTTRNLRARLKVRRRDCRPLRPILAVFQHIMLTKPSGARCPHPLALARPQAVGRVCRARPHVVLVPLVVTGLMIGLGVWAVVQGAAEQADSRR